MSLCCSPDPEPEQEVELGPDLGLLVELCVKQCPGATVLLGRAWQSTNPSFNKTDLMTEVLGQ